MDPITHTIIAVTFFALSFYLGKHLGRRDGIALGITVLSEFFTSKFGKQKMSEYEEEFLTHLRRKNEY